MVRIKRWVPALLTVVAATLMLSAAPAAAAVKSTVTISSGEGTEFTGKVASPTQRCRVGRTVKLFREDESGGGSVLQGTAKTSGSGSWTMEGSFLAGVFYARVLPAIFHQHGMAIHCAGDFSLRQHF
jgi:hypothetical protein